MAPSARALRRGLIVSCQAGEDSPMHGPVFMAAMARAAMLGGAMGIRANGPDDISAIRACVDLPIIGILKRRDPRFPVYITPDFPSARNAAAAGADVIAIDATPRVRDGADDLAALIRRIHAELSRPVMADVSNAAEGAAAAALGADYVASTLSGYTGDFPPGDTPDLDLISALVARCSGIPVIAEGRYATPEQVAEAFSRGAQAVVIGTAITNPTAITRRFVAATPA
jgi:putative N-acetylmannosamine-6-phosphate epimerase